MIDIDGNTPSHVQHACSKGIVSHKVKITFLLCAHTLPLLFLILFFLSYPIKYMSRDRKEIKNYRLKVLIDQNNPVRRLDHATHAMTREI